MIDLDLLRGGDDLSSLLIIRLPQFLSQLLAGTEAGVILVMLFNPLWLTKTRLALQGVTKVGRPYTGFVGKRSLNICVGVLHVLTSDLEDPLHAIRNVANIHG